MKRFVDGVEVDFPHDVELRQGHDRLYVTTPEGTFSAVAVRQGETTLVSFKGVQYKVERRLARASKGRSADSGEFVAPMPGAIVAVLVETGQEVAKGERLFVFEAMKTQQPFSAPFDGVVGTVSVAVGSQVAEGDPLMIVVPKADTHG